MITVEEYLGRFQTRLENERQFAAKQIADLPLPHSSIEILEFQSWIREAVMMAFTSSTLAELMQFRYHNDVHHKFVTVFSRMLRCQVNLYDAVKTYYFYKNDELTLVPEDTGGITLEEMKVLLSESFEQNCAKRGVEPDSDVIDELKWQAPYSLVQNLRVYAKILRGGYCDGRDIIHITQEYENTLGFLYKAFVIWRH